MSFKLLVLLTVLAVLESGSALKCYDCQSSGHLDDCRAHQTVVECPSLTNGCMEVEIATHGSVKGCFNIGCDGLEPQPSYCKKCTTDLCNDK